MSGEDVQWPILLLVKSLLGSYAEKTIRSVRSFRVWFIWIPRRKGWLRRRKHRVCFRGGNDDCLPWLVVPLTLPLIASECFGSGRNLHLFGFRHQDSWLRGNNWRILEDSTPLTWPLLLWKCCRGGSFGSKWLWTTARDPVAWGG